jgi:hypothetical protein
MVKSEFFKQICGNNRSFLLLAAIPRKKMFAVEQTEENLADPEKQGEWWKFADGLCSLIARFLNPLFDFAKMISVARQAAWDRQLSIWNLRPVKQHELLIPQLEPLLNPLGDYMFVSIAVRTQRYSAKEAYFPSELRRLLRMEQYWFFSRTLSHDRELILAHCTDDSIQSIINPDT